MAKSTCPCLDSLSDYGIDDGTPVIGTVRGVAHNFGPTYGLGACEMHDLWTNPDCGAREQNMCAAGGELPAMPTWCAKAWCYVPANCTEATSPSQYLTDVVAAPHFSYATCGTCDAFTNSSLPPLSPSEQTIKQSMPQWMTYAAVGIGIFAVGLACVVLALGRRHRAVRAQMKKLLEGRLHYAGQPGTFAEPKTLQKPLEYHLFLSHSWRNGQDQMRNVKTQLPAMVPGLRPFLDMDDLQVGLGAEDVDKCMAFLCFIADGYFQSANCFRELLRAHVLGIPIIVMMEPETTRHGGLTNEEVENHLRTAYEHAVTDWQLDEEVGKWEGAQPGEFATMPSLKELRRTLFETAMVYDYQRVPAFLDVTLRQLAEQLVKPFHGSARRRSGWLGRCSLHSESSVETSGELHDSSAKLDDTSYFSRRRLRTSSKHDGVSGIERSEKDNATSPGSTPFRQSSKPRTRLFMPRELNVKKLKPLRAPLGGRQFHLYVSPRNQGALELVKEFQEQCGHNAQSMLKISTDKGMLLQCEQMLVYLTDQTWTQHDSGALGRYWAKLDRVPTSQQQTAHLVTNEALCKRLAGGVDAFEQAEVDDFQLGSVSSSSLARVTMRDGQEAWFAPLSTTKAFATEVYSAMLSSTPLLLVHERPTNVREERTRPAAAFDTFFDTTPKPLLAAGIYDKVALPLMSGPHRTASFVMLHTMLNEGIRMKGVGTFTKGLGDIVSIFRSGGRSNASWDSASSFGEVSKSTSKGRSTSNGMMRLSAFRGRGQTLQLEQKPVLEQRFHLQPSACQSQAVSRRLSVQTASSDAETSPAAEYRSRIERWGASPDNAAAQKRQPRVPSLDLGQGIASLWSNKNRSNSHRSMNLPTAKPSHVQVEIQTETSRSNTQCHPDISLSSESGPSAGVSLNAEETSRLPFHRT